MARKRATLTDLLNELTFRVLYNKYKLLACSKFGYDGLPEGMKERNIENLLFHHGRCAYFKAEDEGLSFMCLEVCDDGKYNYMGEPLGYIATGRGFTKHLKPEECVIIENNMFHMNTEDFVYFYVNKMAEAERTMDVNVKACKTPYIIACDDKDVLTFKRIFQQIDGNTPAIFADKGLNLNAIEVLKTDAKFLCNEIDDYIKSVECKLMTLLGFNNTAIDKKERVNVAETNANNEIIEVFSKLQKESREKALKEIKKKFGHEITLVERTLEEVMSNVDDNSLRNNETDN